MIIILKKICQEIIFQLDCAKLVTANHACILGAAQAVQWQNQEQHLTGQAVALTFGAFQ